MGAEKEGREAELSGAMQAAGGQPSAVDHQGVSLLNPGTEGSQEQSCAGGVLPVQSH